jgi:hypothetical protein
MGRRETEVAFAAPVADTRCTALVAVRVPLRGANGTRPGAARLVSRARMATGVPDTDRLRLVCLPAGP